jgi:hypothetical protein
MQDRDPWKLLRAHAVAGALAVSLSLALGGAAFAQSAADDEEENVPLDTKIFRQIMKDIGMYRDGRQIEYRERAPLVVPPTRDLPKPQEGNAALNPAWPKDPDVVGRRKQATAVERAKLKGSADSATDDARNLGPHELNRGGRAAAKSGAPARDVDDANRPMTPDELGNKRSVLDTFRNAFTPQKPESATFTNEPARQSMTSPPPGYQTPSPNHAYGVGQKDSRKASTVMDRAEEQR